MKKLTIALFVAALALGAAVAEAKEWKKVRVGVEGAYPPFSAVDPSTGKLVGFDIDIAWALCDQMKVECEMVAHKYYNSPAKFVRKKGSGIEITAESMKGKKVGVQRATTHDSFITGEFGDTVEIKRYGTQDEAYLDMTAGRIDLLLADSVAMDDGFLKTDAGKGYEFVGPNFADPKYFGDGAGIAVRKQDDDLREMFNAAIDAIRANGVYKQINDKYFNFDIYGS
jgi:arginine/ornithine transport system substrate-binding protein